jgi:aryl-alcohol dehydrogenase-like predicted oxidoreductase
LQAVRDLQRQFAALNVPLATAALQFAHRHPAASSVLIATANVPQLDANMHSLSVPLSPPALARLEAIIAAGSTIAKTSEKDASY